MLVRALEACFVDGQRRRAGAEFEYAGEVPPHLVPVKGAAPKPEVKTEKPVALSEMANSEKPKSFVESVAKAKPKSPEK